MTLYECLKETGNAKLLNPESKPTIYCCKCAEEISGSVVILRKNDYIGLCCAQKQNLSKLKQTVAEIEEDELKTLNKALVGFPEFFKLWAAIEEVLKNG